MGLRGNLRLNRTSSKSWIEVYGFVSLVRSKSVNVMYPEEDYIQLSAIQHYVFCPRQCGLIHVDGIWNENTFTAKGKILHERVDSGEDETRNNVRTVRGLAIYSKRLGLSGRADVVEFIRKDDGEVVFPVEYKSGMPKRHIADLAQLCAQALCLEEMLGLPVPQAAVYYGKPRRRYPVGLDDELRNQTEEIILRIHEMRVSGLVPGARKEKKCATCSLAGHCMPGIGNRKVGKYIEELYRNNEAAS